MYLFLTSVLMDHCKLGGFKQWTLTILQLQKPALGWGTQGVGRAGSSQKLQAKTQPLLLPASGSCPKPQLLPASLQSLLPLSLPPLPHGLSFPLEREPCDYVDGPQLVESRRRVLEDLKDKPVSWTFYKKKLERSTAFIIGSWQEKRASQWVTVICRERDWGQGRQLGFWTPCKDPGAGVPQWRRVVPLGEEEGAEGRTGRGRSGAEAHRERGRGLGKAHCPESCSSCQVGPEITSKDMSLTQPWEVCSQMLG